MWPFLVTTITVISAVLGVPALVVWLWGLLRWRNAETLSPFRSAILKASRAVLLVFGALAVGAGVIVPWVLSEKPPIRDEALIAIAPQFARPEFNLAYTSTFGSNADFRVEYLPLGPKPERVCFTLGNLQTGGFAGWMIILWSQFFFRFFQDLGYPANGRDLSQYSTLSLEVKGTVGGETVEVAIKDKTDNHREVRHKLNIPEGSTDWQFFDLNLGGIFTGVDFTQIETITLSMNREQSVCVRNIMLK
jgi:hypothetical protein